MIKLIDLEVYKVAMEIGIRFGIWLTNGIILIRIHWGNNL